MTRRLCFLRLARPHVAVHGRRKRLRKPGETSPREDAESPSVPVAPHPYAYVTVRLTAAEFDRVAAAARAAGQTLPEFVHDAAVTRATGAS